MRGKQRWAKLTCGAAVLVAVLVIVLAGSAALANGEDLLGTAGRSISGTVTDDSGTPLEGVKVEIWDRHFLYYGVDSILSTLTAADGTYTFSGLLPMYAYFVGTDNGQGRLDEYYQGVERLDYDAWRGRESPYPHLSPTAVDLTEADAGSIDFALSAGRTISGLVTDETGNPLEGVRIEVLSEYGTLLKSALTSADGTYVADALPHSLCRVRTSNEQALLDEWYDNALKQSDAYGYHATLLDLTEADAAGIDFRLSPGRTISGLLTDEEGNPLEAVKIEVLTEGGGLLKSAITDSDGAYTVTALAPSTYLLRTSNDQGYLDEWYDEVPREGNAYSYAATRIDLTEADVAVVDFQLALCRTISGLVTDEQGTPLENIRVSVRDDKNQGPSKSTLTAADGTYAVAGLSPAKYKIWTSNEQGYRDEWYDNVPETSPQQATLVDLFDADATEIDFQLTLLHAISGKVTDESGAPLENVRVRFAPRVGASRWVDTEADGTYVLRPDPECGPYRVHTENNLGYLDEWYENVRMFDDPSGLKAAKVDTAATDVAGIDFQLGLGRRISGTVTNEQGDPLYEVCVIAYGPTWQSTSAETDRSGSYTVDGLPPDAYKLRTSDIPGYLDEWYDDIPRWVDYWGNGATPVDVTAADATAVDFKLQPSMITPPPAPTLGTITGKVTDGQGAPLRHVNVISSNGASASTGANGTYTISVPVPGTYSLWTSNLAGYVDEWYGPGHVVKIGNDSGTGRELVEVQLSGAAGIDFNLLPGYTISGYVTAYSEIWIYNQTGMRIAIAYNQWIPFLPFYRSPTLPPGIYYARTRTDTIDMLADEWYDGKYCEKFDLADADPIDLTSGSVHNVNFVFERRASIWRVTPGNGPTAGGTQVVIHGSGFSGVEAVSFGGVPATTYKVDSSTQITAITPPHAAGLAGVQVTIPAGSGFSGDFTYQSAPSTTLRGTDRYDTAIKISQAMFPGALPAGAGLVLAPGETFPEALCGGPLAAAYGGPVLLTPKTGLNNAVRAELQRLQPTYVVCIGFYDGVKNAVQAALPGATVSVIRGITANQMSYKVALALKAKLGSLSTATAIITRGDKFADAIAVSPLACANKWPILLTGPSVTNSLSIYATQALGVCGIKKAIKVGTYAQLPAGVTGLANLSGTDRYHTNCNVAEWGKSNAGLRFVHLGIATGDKFPDALAAGPYLALDKGILLLSPLTGLPQVIGAEISANAAAVEEISFIAVIEPVIGQVRARLQ